LQLQAHHQRPETYNDLLFNLNTASSNVLKNADTTGTIKKNTEALLDASKGVGLEVNPEKTEYVLMSRYQEIGQKHNIKIANRSFEDVAKFNYPGTTLTDQNWMHKDTKSRLNSGNACYHWVQSFVLSPAV
jgi:hypothetical protein